MYIFGIHPVSEALQATPERVQRLIVVRGKTSPRLQVLIDQARAAAIPVVFEPEQALNRKAQGISHQSIGAEMAPVPLKDLDVVLDNRPPRILLADGVEDPRNLGALLRTAEAAGVTAVLFPARHGCGITPTVLRASAGAALHLDLVQIGNTVRTLEVAKERGYWVVGLDMRGQEDWSVVDAGRPLMLVVGGEDRGLRRLVREHCDYLLRIPMRGRISSLNLAVAAGILMYGLPVKAGTPARSRD
jgi:23S rRNA (guanosine2251-2'-O)-methyltransferase